MVLVIVSWTANVDNIFKVCETDTLCSGCNLFVFLWISKRIFVFEMYLYLCDACIFVYLGTYGVESCATLGSSSWQLAELATAVAAEGEAIEASYIAETENPEFKCLSKILAAAVFSWFCEPYLPASGGCQVEGQLQRRRS